MSTVDCFRTQHSQELSVTWTGDGVGTRLDRIYAPAHLLKPASSAHVTNTGSDHDGVCVTLCWSPIQHGRSYWKLNTSVLKLDDYQDKITSVINEWKTLHFPTRSIGWDVLKRRIAAQTRHFADPVLLYSTPRSSWRN